MPDLEVNDEVTYILYPHEVGRVIEIFDSGPLKGSAIVVWEDGQECVEQVNTLTEHIV